MSFNLKAWQNHAEAVINTPIPEELVQTREQAGQTLHYINSATAIAILNRAFGVAGWEFVKVAAGPRESLEDKRGNKGHTYVYEGELHVFLPDENGMISRDNYASFPAYGTKTMFGGTNEDQMADKSAQSDCFKKCASIVGIGAQLYFKKKSMYRALTKFLDELGVDPEPSPWDDDDVVAAHKEGWEYLMQLKEDTGANDSDLDEMAEQWSGGSVKSVLGIAPEKFDSFVEYMRDIASAGSEDESAAS